MALAGLVSIALGTHVMAQASHVWTHASGTDNWAIKTVSLGNQGTEVFSDFQVSGGLWRLLSAYDGPVATPVWQGTGLYSAAYCHVASAQTTSEHVSLHYAQATSGAPCQPVLSLYHSSSSSAAWTYTFPMTVVDQPSGVQVSDDGLVIAAWVFTPTNSMTTLSLFTPQSPVPVHSLTLATFSEPHVVLSRDGSTLLICSPHRVAVMNTASGSIGYDVTNWNGSGGGDALSANGSTIIKSRADGKLDILQRQGSTYILASTYDPATPYLACTAAACDALGQHVVTGWLFEDNTNRSRVQVLDLTGSQAQVEFSEDIPWSGTSTSMISCARMAKDGHSAVIGQWGNGIAGQPEVIGYRHISAQSGWQRVVSFDTPGSVVGLDMADDGERFVVASKNGYLYSNGSGGQIDLFDMRNRDLVLSGIPYPGTTVTVLQTLPPGTNGRLLASAGLASVPVQYPFGSLFLDPLQLTIPGGGTANAQGQLAVSIAIPNLSNLIGTTIHYQGFGTSPRHLSQDRVDMTILP